MAKRQLLLLLIGLLSAGGAMAGPDAVLQLLDKKSCSGCNLQGADLVYAEFNVRNYLRQSCRVQIWGVQT